MDTQDCKPYLPRTSNATTATRLLTGDAVRRAKEDTRDACYPFRKASDGYHHLEEDIGLLKELGLDIYRMSIGWSRLYPRGDEEEPNLAGIEYYTRVFQAVRSAGIRIFLTMNHYAVPLYLVEHYGGWTNRKTIDFYLRFAKTVFENWGDLIDYYLPFNEINAGYFSPYNGVGLIREGEEPYERAGKIFYRGGPGHAGNFSESGRGQAPAGDRRGENRQRRRPGGGDQPQRLL